MAKTKQCPQCYGHKTIDVWEEVARSEISVTAERREKICPTCNGTGEVSVTNGDRYRAMSDEEMAEALSEVDVCPTRADRTLCGDREGCKRCWLDYLRSPADKETNDDKELAAISAILESGKCPFSEKVCPKHYLCSRCIEEDLKNTAAERRTSG